MKFVHGDIFESGADCLVNPVNCLGVSGAGLAKQFARRFPENQAALRLAALRGEIRIGQIFTWKVGDKQFVLNFPTKRHWREPSRLEDIEAGLKGLITTIDQRLPRAIAIPALGCGLGGLKWRDVRLLLKDYLGPMCGPKVIVYEPEDQC